MKSVVILVLVLVPAVLTAVVACRSTVARTSNQKVLLITRERSNDMELMLTQEVDVMIRMLKAAGFQVVVASASGRPLQGQTTALTPDMKLADVYGDDYVGVILPCLAASVTPFPPEAVAIVKQAVAAGKPVAAQQSAVRVLGQAGALKAKRYASSYTVPEGIDEGRGVVQDGNIITSGTCPNSASPSHPEGTAKLTQKLIDALTSGR